MGILALTAAATYVGRALSRTGGTLASMMNMLQSGLADHKREHVIVDGAEAHVDHARSNHDSTTALKASTRSILGMCPAPSITSSFDSGMPSRSCSASATGVYTSSLPTTTSVGTRIFRSIGR